VIFCLVLIATFFFTIVKEGAACYCLRLGKLRPNAILPGIRLRIPIIDELTPIPTRNVLEETSMVSINTLADNFVMKIETLTKYKLRPQGVVRFADTWTQENLSLALQKDAREIVRRIIGKYTHDQIGADEDLRNSVLADIKEQAEALVMGYKTTEPEYDEDGNPTGGSITRKIPGKYSDVLESYELILQNPDFDPKWLDLQGQLVSTKKEQEISAQKLIVAQNEKKVTETNADAYRYAQDQENAAYLRKAKELAEIVGEEKAGKILANEALKEVQVYSEGGSGGGTGVVINPRGGGSGSSSGS